MKISREYSQCKGLLFPPSLDTFVPEDHEVCIINNVVDSMDLSPLLAKYWGGGAPAYPSPDVECNNLRLQLGHLQFPKLCQGLKTDTAFIFLSAVQFPYFRTRCLFHAEYADVLPNFFVEVVRLCASLGTVELRYIAFDGTNLKANAPVIQTKGRDGLEKEIERIKEQMRQMIQASAISTICRTRYAPMVMAQR